MTAQSLFSSGNINACISVLEKNLQNPLENEIFNNTLPAHSDDAYFRGLRFLLLARAYESQENKPYAI